MSYLHWNLPRPDTLHLHAIRSDMTDTTPKSNWEKSFRITFLGLTGESPSDSYVFTFSRSAMTWGNRLLLWPWPAIARRRLWPKRSQANSKIGGLMSRRERKIRMN